MEISRNDCNTTSEMLERASQVLALTYHDWRLHERPQTSGKRRKNRQQHSAAGNLPSARFYTGANRNAFA